MTTTTDRRRRGSDEPGGDPADTARATATTTGVSNEKLAMWAFLGSECLLFGALISTYFLYRGRSSPDPTPKQIYDIPFTSVSSFVLLMSSLTMVLALAAIQRGDHRRLRVWLTATALLGSHLHRRPGLRVHLVHPRGPDLRTNLFGSSFFVLTGFHGVHVTLGIMMLLSLVNLSVQGTLPQSKVRGGRDHRPLLALRRRGVDHHLHRRLPDPGAGGPRDAAAADPVIA